MQSAMDAVQMNIRIDRELKREGDAAFNSVGYTPSQAVRLLWKIAVSLRDRPEELAAYLKGPAFEQSVDSCQQEKGERDAKLRSFQEGQRKISEMIGELGISSEADSAEPTLEEFREQIALERLYAGDEL